MAERQKYCKRTSQAVTAVPLALDTDGFSYRKWGDTQHCKAGDWVVNNGGDVYTVDRESFRRTYREVSPGRYIKAAPVWAERAERDGSVQTKEGLTHYRAGDYLVSNEPSGSDAYAVAADTFDAMYEPAD